MSMMFVVWFYFQGLLVCLFGSAIYYLFILKVSHILITCLYVCL
jgi:hypothetical protein